MYTAVKHLADVARAAWLETAVLGAASYASKHSAHAPRPISGAGASQAEQEEPGEGGRASLAGTLHFHSAPVQFCDGSLPTLTKRACLTSQESERATPAPVHRDGVVRTEKDRSEILVTEYGIKMRHKDDQVIDLTMDTDSDRFGLWAELLSPKI